MDNVTYPVTGACQCGEVTYRLLEPPLKIVACHCTECQKLSTSAFSITAIVNENTIEFFGKLSEWRRIAGNGNTVAAKFCPTCSNRIYHYNPDAPEQLKLKPCNLSNTAAVHPTVHIWVSEKQSWFDIPKNATVFETQP